MKEQAKYNLLDIETNMLLMIFSCNDLTMIDNFKLLFLNLILSENIGAYFQLFYNMIVDLMIAWIQPENIGVHDTYILVFRVT